LLAVLNSRMKVEMASESTSGWRDHELSLPHPGGKSDIRFNVSSSAGSSQSAGVLVITDVVTTDESKVQSLFDESS
jgi:hypothetical protein